MKKLAVLSLMLFAFTGCMTLPNYTYTPFVNQTLTEGQEKLAGMGDTFFEYSEGQTATEPTYIPSGTVASGIKYDLTIVELNHEKLGLQYNEFIFQPGAQYTNYMYVLGGGGWLVKEGFNKRFDYTLADKIVRFKGYEFEILSVENGQIKYRRVK